MPYLTLYPFSDVYQVDGCVGGPCRDAPPRNTCEAHPLCSQMLRTGELCCDPAAPPHMYCTVHTAKLYSSNADETNKAGRGREVAERQQIPGQCTGMKTGSDKSRCKSPGIVLLGGLSWCNAHRHQYVPGTEPSRSPAVAQTQPERAILPASSSAPVSVFERGDN